MIRNLNNEQRWQYFSECQQRELLWYNRLTLMVRICRILQSAGTRYMTQNSVSRQLATRYGHGQPFHPICVKQAIADLKRINVVGYTRPTRDLRDHYLWLN